jgi:NAD-dependent deacetylase
MQETMTPDQCADVLGKARRIVVLTGAGISTSAGVPDFRGPRGLYVTRRYDPELVFDIDAFLRNPEPFLQRGRFFTWIISAAIEMAISSGV